MFQVPSLALPDLVNMTGRWYDIDGHEIPIDEAVQYLRNGVTLACEAGFQGDPNAGVMTIFVPFDVLPARNKTAPPHVFVTAEVYTIRRPFRSSRVHADYTQFAQTKTAALSAHDQAVVHVRQQVKRYGRWWRRVRWTRWIVMFLAGLGLGTLLQVIAYLTYSLT